MDYGGKRFFAPSASCSSIKNTYKLHSVFVNRMPMGHSVYIKRQDRWFKFEDEQVTQVEGDEVFHSHQRSPFPFEFARQVFRRCIDDRICFGLHSFSRSCPNHVGDWQRRYRTKHPTRFRSVKLLFAKAA